MTLALTIAPGYLTCCTAASQLLMYVLLIIKMNYHLFIFSNHDPQNAAFIAKYSSTMRRREFLANLIGGTFTLAMPILFAAYYIGATTNAPHKESYWIHWWSLFNYSLLVLVTIVCAGLAITTVILSVQISRVFSDKADARQIKVNLAVFLTTYTFRLLVSAGVHLFEKNAFKIYFSHHAIYNGSAIAVWTLTEIVPFWYLIWVHNKNFRISSVRRTSKFETTGHMSVDL